MFSHIAVTPSRAHDNDDLVFRRRCSLLCPQELELHCQSVAGLSAPPRARLLLGKEGKPRGLALVQLGGADDAEAAAGLLDGRALGGRELRVKRDGA